MNEHDLLTERFARLANDADDSDWADVLRRAGQTSRRWLAFPLAAALAVVAVGSALAFHRQIVDFFGAEPAPERVVLDFGQLGIHVTPNLGPKTIPEQARKVMDLEARGKHRALFVAPTVDGGFCWLIPGMYGSCGRIQPNQRKLGAVVLDSPEGGPADFSGYVLDTSVTKLEVTYEDGGSIELPITWVTPPIDAGFYAFEVPPDHLREGHRARMLRALDEHGDVVATYPFRYNDPRWDSGADGLPRIADRSRKRTLFDFRTEAGARLTLVVAPAPENRLCYAYDRGGGCRSPKFPTPPVNLGLHGGNEVLLCCEVGDDVANVELRFEDGDRIALPAIEGFVYYAIPSRHYALGHRLGLIVGFDSKGREIGRNQIRTDVRGVYPCAKSEELKLPYDLTICP
jgi:hypothetical protein